MLRLLTCLLLALPALTFADDEPKTPKAKTPEGPLAEARQRWLRGNYEEARAQYEMLLDKEKLRGQAAIGIARSHLSVGDDVKALAAIEVAIKKDAKDPDLLAARADILFGLGRWDEASKDAAWVPRADRLPLKTVAAVCRRAQACQASFAQYRSCVVSGLPVVLL